MEQMVDINKRLKLCVKWFQRVEDSLHLEQEKLRNALELSEKKCNDTGNLVNSYIGNGCWITDSVYIVYKDNVNNAFVSRW